MSDVFISYRHEDSKSYAGRIFDRLKRSFGADHVFMDITAIHAGSDFVVAIDKALGRSGAFVVVIGRQWLSIADEHGNRRLDDPRDFVRLESAAALARGTRIVPVLVDNASMPSAEALPDNLKKLARIQALELSDRRWDFDMDQLVRELSGPGGKAPTAELRKPAPYTGPQPRSYVTAAATISVLLAFFFGSFMTLVLTLLVPEPVGVAFADVWPWALVFGFFLGIIFGAFFTGDMTTVVFTVRDEFEARLYTAMSEYGFVPERDTPDLLSFRPSTRAGLGVGRISVAVGEGTATIVGPVRYVRKLKSRLR